MATQLYDRIKEEIESRLGDLLDTAKMVADIYFDATNQIFAFLDLVTQTIESVQVFVKNALQTITPQLQKVLKKALNDVYSTLKPEEQTPEGGALSPKQDVISDTVDNILKIYQGVQNALQNIVMPLLGDVNTLLSNTLGKINEVCTEIDKKLKVVEELLSEDATSSVIQKAMSNVFRGLSSIEDFTTTKIDQATEYASSLLQEKLVEVESFILEKVNLVFLKTGMLTSGARSIVQ